MIYKLAKEIITVKRNDKVLIYNYFAHKICIVNSEIFEKMCDGNFNFASSTITKLLRNAVIYCDEEEYIKKDYLKEHVKQCENRKVNAKCIYLHVTQKCNLKCSYCYNVDNLNKRVDELSFATIEKIIKSFRDNGGEIVVLTGGEALTRDDIIDVARSVKKIGLKCELLTNGTFLFEKKDILECLDNVIISLDTFEKEKNKRNGLDISALKRNLEMIPIKYREKISVRAVISAEDTDSWKKIKAFCKKCNYSFIPNLYIPNSLKEEEMVPEYIELPQPETVEMSANYCGAGYAEIAVDSDGKVYPCQTLVRKGFQVADSIYSTFDQEVINLFKNRRLDLVKECNECEYKYLCGGGCPAVSYKLYGDLYVAPKPLCKHLKHEIDKKLEGLLVKYG